MSNPSSHPFAKSHFYFSLLFLSLFILLLSSTYSAEAISPDIVISQVYGGGGNSGAPYTNDFVELFNRGTTTVNITGWSVQYASATGTGNFGGNPVTVLNGSLAPGQYYLVQQAGGDNGDPLPTPDAIGTVNMSGTSGKVVVVNQSTGLACNGGSTPCSPAQSALIVDLVGYGGANFSEGSPAPGLTNITAAFRASGGCTDTDENSSDFSTATPNPRNTTSPFNVCGGDTAPAVSSTTPANGATDIALDANIEITFSEAVNVSASWFNISCGSSAMHSAISSGGPTTFTLDPDADFVNSESCTITILASEVTDQDSDDPPDNMDADYIFSFDIAGPVVEVPEIIITEIMYDPDSTEDNWEWIEVYNAGSNTVDLSGFVVDDINGVDHSSANIAGGTLAAGEQAILYNVDDVSAADFAAAWGNVNLIPVTDWSVLSLNNTGDQVGLWASFADYAGDNTTHANAFDTVSFSSGAGFPDPIGASIYLTDLSADNNVGSNWATSTDGGATPLFTGYTSAAAGGNSGTDVGSPGTPVVAAEVVINEFSASTTGTDVEYVEIFGTPNTDFSSFTVLEIEGDSESNEGTVDDVISLGTTDASGFYLANLPANALENGTLTLLLVNNFSGAAGNDLDTNDDGTFDVTPWNEIVDTVAVNDGGAGDLTYGLPVLGPNYDGLSPFAPGGASRIPDGFDTAAATDWARNDFDLAGIPGFDGTPVVGEAYNTPGEPNELITVVIPPFGICGDPATLISAVQGNGPASLLVGEIVTIEGVVVSGFQGLNEIGGYHVQEQDTDTDTDPLTSEGIHVLDNANTPGIGDVVRVQGTVAENFGLTRLESIVNFANCASSDVATPATVSLPVTSVDDFEKYEGMAVTIPQSLVISEFFNFDRFGEIVLTTDSRFQPTAQFEPGSPDAAQAMQDFLLNRITLDDGRGNQNPDPAIHPNGNIFDLTNLFRYGDTVANVTGVMDFAFGLYRIQPTQGADYTAANPRPATPDDVGGSLEVASFNVLNYFTTIDTGAFICGPAGNQECRGADNMDEFTRQRDKIIAALATMNSDVVGLIEIENHPADVPAADLVSGLNTVLGAGTYDYIATGAIGTDAIRVAFIYKPASVSPLGDYAVLDTSVDPRFLDNLNRPVLAQTFQDNTTGGIFTVAVNHLKSKGSDCNDVGDPDTGDGSGNCNLTRKAAAEALVDWLATDPTGSDGEGFLIIGDLNSYDKEDPIDAIKAGPDDTPGTSDDYTDLVFHFQGEDAYSYLFDGQLGYLDHALANAGLVDEITGVTVWHINADEPDLIDYDTTFKLPAQDAIYAPDAYRSSDHDPVIVGLNLNSAPTIVVAPGGICAGSGGTMNLTVDDANGDSLTLSATSSNTTAVPNVNIVFGGSGSNRTVSITAVAGSTVRNSTVTITVSDGSASAETTIEVVIGTSGNNSSLMGTSDADLILGLSGNDTLSGLAGNDLLCAGSGNDTLSGGEDDDTLDGASGNDELNGDDGNDVLLGDSGNDKLNGGAGNDTLIGDSGNDDMDGGTGNDVLDGGTGNDKMKGGAGDDSMSGGSGNDELTGGPDADFFSGGQGNDTNTDFNAGEGDTSDGT